MNGEIARRKLQRWLIATATVAVVALAAGAWALRESYVSALLAVEETPRAQGPKTSGNSPLSKGKSQNGGRMRR